MRAAIERSDLERFREILAASLGLSFDETKIDELADALRDRLGATGCGSGAAYLARLTSRETSRDELRALASRLAVGETSFFRYPAHFRALEEVALPARMRARRDDRTLRVLSAGSASGEEAYTIAILLRERIGDLGSWRVMIQAVDVNPEAIRTAREAHYSAWSLRETPPEMIERWFVKTGRGLVLDRRVREMVSFEERNLLDEDPSFWSPGTFDIIFCRNVIIYFSAEAIQTVTSRLSRSLAGGGFLFMGHSETLRGLAHDFDLIHTHDTFYYQKRPVGERARTPLVDPGRPRPSVTDRVETLAGRLHEEGASHNPPPAPSPDLSGATEMFRQERYEEALDRLRATPSETEADPDALLLVAASHALRGELEESDRICRRALALDEMNPGAHYLLALCREQADDPAGARRHAGAAAHLDPTFAMPHLQLGRMARREGRLETARHELGQALRLLAREDASRILLFGGGFRRAALTQLCQSELRACGEPR